MKHFYTVLVASQQYHGEDALTYSSDDALAVRSVVLVPLQRRAVLGVIISEVDKPKFATKDILEAYELPPLPDQLIKLADWLGDYYPAPLGVIAQQLLPTELKPKTIAALTPLTSAIPPQTSALPPLTDEQAAALATLTQTTDTFILHGDTGTGKTRVYIEAVQRVLAAGKSAVVLTPEIGLTSQLEANFTSVFGDRVVLVHSQLTPKQRQQTWLRILTAAVPLVVLGPRSALFSPLSQIGIIIVDEAHEPAYKQEQAPHYHAVRVASQLAHLHGASLVLGSATPAIGDYFLAEQKGKHIIRMTERAAATSARRRTNGAGTLAAATETQQSAAATTLPTTPPTPKPTTQLIDLKDRTNFTRSQYLSTALLQSIETSLQRGEQSLLYLNRRGTARVILCNQCGWQAVCPHCDLPLTYHHDLHKLQCHTCGFETATPTSCPDCKNVDIVFKVVGTKAIEEEVNRLYPSARVMRFDTDNKKSESFAEHYAAIKRGEVDILVGTQLLAKGLDLPKLTTLGVVIADTSLTFPDYSSEERTYQLLAQVIGRVGRGHSTDERIIVQSYAPERTVIHAAIEGDWDAFYQTELKERELFFFPPFSYALKLTVRRATSRSAEKAAEDFAAVIQAMRLPVVIEGPMPSFHIKVGDKFQWQLIIKSKQRAALLRIIHAVKTDAKSGWAYDIDPINLL